MTMISLVKSIRWCLICFLISTSHTEANASEVDGFLNGTREYMRIIYVQPDYVLVGAKNIMYNISTVTMELVAAYEWKPTRAHVKTCQDNLGLYLNDCESYVRSALPQSDSQFVICASSAKQPSCQTLSLTEEGWVWGEFIWTTVDSSSMAYAPVFPWEELVLYKTTEGAQYVATHFYISAMPNHILFRERITLADEVLPAMSTAQNPGTINSDFHVGLQPRFVKIFETDAHVYLLFAEPAQETYSVQKAVYSRIARVCKHDTGNPQLGSYQLVTFFKTRLQCGNPGKMLNGNRQRVSGEYPFYFDEIAGATDLHTLTTEPNGEKVLIAAFNSPANSIGGAAVCMYRLSDIERVFETSPQVIQSGSGNTGSEWTTRPTAGNPPARCPEDTRQLTSDQVESVKHPLLKNPVNAIDNTTLFIQTGAGFRVTQIVVDWAVPGPDGQQRTVIFLATDTGKLVKLVKYRKADEAEARFHAVEERQVFAENEPIREMKMIRDSSNKKHLLLNTYVSVKRVAVEKCHHYTSCADCVAVRDPYCSWSVSHAACVSTSHSAKDRYQNIEEGQLDICAADSLSTTTSTMVTEKPVDDGKTASGGQPGNTAKVVAEDGAGSSGAGRETVLIVLVVVMSLVCLIGGFVAGFFIHKLKSRSITANLDRLAEKKDRKKIVNRSESEDYQNLPTNLTPPPNNLDYKNNLAVKSINTSPVDPAMIGGESTLSRTKKSYV